nr:hypothetical protein Itr_chr07CG09820 [Ipomoea trifida]
MGFYLECTDPIANGSLPPLPSNSYKEEQLDVCRVEQPPERGINDTAGAWVSTRVHRLPLLTEFLIGLLKFVAKPPTVPPRRSQTTLNWKPLLLEDHCSTVDAAQFLARVCSRSVGFFLGTKERDELLVSW